MPTCLFRSWSPSLVTAALAALLFACGAPAPTAPPPDAGGLPLDGGTGDGGTSDDGGTTDAGQWDLPGIDYAIEDLSPPLQVPNETWTFVPIPESRCANGTPTGVAVNLTQRSNRVLIFMAGGGACWEAGACALGAAVHITDTMGETAVLNEAKAGTLAPIFDRDEEANPFRDASFVYIPYCTGDLHGGTRVHTYDWFGPKPLHHVGANNMHFYLAHLRATFRNADRVWLSGGSAGGFGATLNWWRTQKAMPWARVDVFNDSGLVIDTSGDGRYGTMQNHWGLVFPPGCTDCTAKLSSVLTRSAELLPAPRRYGLLGYMSDQVIANFWALDGATVEARVNAMKTNAAPNVKLFLRGGTDHVMYVTPNVTNSTGLSAREWSQRFASDDASWDHSGP